MRRRARDGVLQIAGERGRFRGQRAIGMRAEFFEATPGRIQIAFEEIEQGEFVSTLVGFE